LDDYDKHIRNDILNAIAKAIYEWHPNYFLQLAGHATDDMCGYGMDDNARDEAERENLCRVIISEAAKAIDRLKDPIPPCPHEYREVRPAWGNPGVVKCICEKCGHRSFEREQQLEVQSHAASGAGI
jgi:hypothetical protein